MPRYCECGRRIVVLKNRGGHVADDEHNLCRKCYESHRDSTRNHA